MKLKICIAFGSSLLLMACSSAFESSFKQSCKAMGAKRSFCACSYQHAQQHYGAERLDSITHPSQLPPDWAEQIQRAGRACIAKLD